jgi:hypothetical protein
MPSGITGEHRGIEAIEVRLMLPDGLAVHDRWVERLARRKQHGHAAALAFWSLDPQATNGAQADELLQPLWVAAL